MGHQRSLSSSSCFFSSSFRVIQRFRRGREVTTHFTSTQENATPLHTHTKLGPVCPQLHIHPQLYFYLQTHPADSSSIFLSTF